MAKEYHSVNIVLLHILPILRLYCSCNMYYVVSQKRDLSLPIYKFRMQLQFFKKYWPEDDLNVGRDMLPYTLKF